MHDADDDLPPPPETGGVKGSSSSTPANMTPLSATNLGSAADTPAARSGTKRKWPPVEEGQTYEYEFQGTEGKVGGVDTLPLKGRKVIAKCVQVKDGLAMRSETEGWEYHPSTSSADNHFNFLRSAVSHLTKTPSKKIRGPAITKFFQKSAAGSVSASSSLPTPPSSSLANLESAHTVHPAPATESFMPETQQTLESGNLCQIDLTVASTVIQSPVQHLNGLTVEQLRHMHECPGYTLPLPPDKNTCYILAMDGSRVTLLITCVNWWERSGMGWEPRLNALGKTTLHARTG